MILGPNLIKIALIVSLIVGLSYKNNIGDIPGNDRSCIYLNRPNNLKWVKKKLHEYKYKMLLMYFDSMLFLP